MTLTLQNLKTSHRKVGSQKRTKRGEKKSYRDSRTPSKEWTFSFCGSHFKNNR